MQATSSFLDMSQIHAKQYLFRILLLLVHRYSGAVHGAELQFSPLTPYQTKESLPPSVNGVLENRSNVNALLMAAEGFRVPASLVSRPRSSPGYGTKTQGQSEGTPAVLPFKSSSLTSLKNSAQQSKTLKVPSGAKLIGYNMQIIAGYIPTTYLEKGKWKNNKGTGKSGKPETFQSSYLKYRPGYSINMKDRVDGAYRGTRRNDALEGTDATQADWVEVDPDDELDRDGLTADTEFGKSKKFLLKHDFTSATSNASTTTAVIGLSGTLWPIVVGELEDGEEEGHKENTNSSQTEEGVRSDSLVRLDITVPTSRMATNYQDIKKRVYGEVSETSSSSVQPTAATSSVRTSPFILFTAPQVERTRAQAPWSAAQQNMKASSRNKYSQMQSNVVSVPPAPQEPDTHRLPQQEIIFPEEPVSVQHQRTKHTDKQHGQPERLMSAKSQTPRRSEIPVRNPLGRTPENLIHTGTSISQNKLPMDQPPAGTIIPIDGPPSVSHTTPDVIAEPSNIENTGSTNQASTTVLPKTTFYVDSSEFADEDYDRAVRNMDGTSSARPGPVANLAENQETQSGNTEQPPNEERPTGRQNSETNAPAPVRGQEKQKSNSQKAEYPGDADEGQEASPPQEAVKPRLRSGHIQERLPEESSKGPLRRGKVEEDSDRNEGDFRANDGDNDDDSEMVRDGDEEVVTDDNAERDAHSPAAAITFPEQIPNFQEWLASLPIHPGFTFGANKGVGGFRGRLPANSGVPFPFFEKFGGRRRAERRKHPSESSEEERRSIREYEYDPGEPERHRFQQQRFALLRNVPYQS